MSGARPADLMPWTAQASSCSERSPLMPAAPMMPPSPPRLRDLRPQDAGAVLPLEGEEVPAGIKHGDSERLQFQGAPMLQRLVDDERGLRKGEGGHG